MLRKISIIFGLVLAVQVLAKPDLGIRNQISGSSNGNLFGTGNIVSNSRSIISAFSSGKYSFNGRWSSLNSSFYLTAMGLKDFYNNMSTPITNLLNSVITVAVNRDVGTNLTRIYQPIIDNFYGLLGYVSTVDVSSLVANYGVATQDIYDSGLMSIVYEFGNMSLDFQTISDQIAIIRSLGSSSANVIAQYIPYNNIANVNNGLKRILATSRVIIANFTEIVKGLQAADNFISSYNITIIKAQQSTNQTVAKFNSSIYSAVWQYNNTFTSSYNQAIGTFNATINKLTNLSSDSIIGDAATATIGNITELITGLQNDLPTIQDSLRNVVANAEIIEINDIYNETNSLFELLQEMGYNISTNMTTRVPNIDLCFNKYIKNNFNALVNAVPKGVDSCTKTENNLFSKTVMAPLAEVVALYYDAQAIASGIQYCLQLGNLKSPAVIKIQMENCLVHYMSATSGVLTNTQTQKDFVLQALPFELGLSLTRLSACVEERIDEVTIAATYYYAALEYCLISGS